MLIDIFTTSFIEIHRCTKSSFYVALLAVFDYPELKKQHFKRFVRNISYNKYTLVIICTCFNRYRFGYVYEQYVSICRTEGYFILYYYALLCACLPWFTKFLIDNSYQVLWCVLCRR